MTRQSAVAYLQSGCCLLCWHEPPPSSPTAAAMQLVSLVAYNKVMDAILSALACDKNAALNYSAIHNFTKSKKKGCLNARRYLLL
jgi:hypothetical protein